MHNNVRLLATAVQPQRTSSDRQTTLELRLYPRGTRPRGYVYRVWTASKRLLPDGVMEVTLDSSYEPETALQGRRPNVIKSIIHYTSEGRDVRLIRVKIIGVLERTLEVPVKSPLTVVKTPRRPWRRSF